MGTYTLRSQSRYSSSTECAITWWLDARCEVHPWGYAFDFFLHFGYCVIIKHSRPFGALSHHIIEHCLFIVAARTFEDLGEEKG